jgi:hypothetical protein
MDGNNLHQCTKWDCQVAFFQAGRNVVEKGNKNDQVKGADKAGQNKHPDRIKQMQITDQQIWE